jgi:hypothetical protein
VNMPDFIPTCNRTELLSFSVSLYIRPSVRLSVNPSIHLSVCLSVYLSIYLSVCVCVCVRACVRACVRVCRYVCLVLGLTYNRTLAFFFIFIAYVYELRVGSHFITIILLREIVDFAELFGKRRFFSVRTRLTQARQ